MLPDKQSFLAEIRNAPADPSLEIGWTRESEWPQPPTLSNRVEFVRVGDVDGHPHYKIKAR